MITQMCLVLLKSPLSFLGVSAPYVGRISTHQDSHGLKERLQYSYMCIFTLHQPKDTSNFCFCFLFFASIACIPCLDQYKVSSYDLHFGQISVDCYQPLHVEGGHPCKSITFTFLMSFHQQKKDFSSKHNNNQIINALKYLIIVFHPLTY